MNHEQRRPDLVEQRDEPVDLFLTFVRSEGALGIWN